MRLQELSSLLTVNRLLGDSTVSISGIQTDSRKVTSGDLFICMPGFVSDGHDFAQNAADSGAAALVVERELNVSLPQVIVKDSRYAMAVIAAHYYNYPSNSMKVIGITGTNGKTTTSCILEKILRDCGFRTGLMGTIRMKVGDTYTDMERTTLEAIDLQRNFRSMADEGTDYCVMEVSSHALDLGRVKGIHYRSGIFTNLTQDHLDYHKTMAKYREAKGLLYARMDNGFQPEKSKKQFAILNADDEASAYFSGLTSAEIITYGIEHECDVRASEIRISAEGTAFHLTSFAGHADMKMKLVGKFNVYNALGAIASTLAEGVPLEKIQHSLEEMSVVDGRMEVVDEGQNFLVLVDYAHTPDGLENALQTIREFTEGRVLTVFGCGGDRDRSKRPLMGKVTAKYSDYLYVTSDNPRTEDPEQILQDIVPGLKESGLPQVKYEMIVDRKTAIELAIAAAGPQDVVLIAGKGHETYQDILGVKHAFDDRLVAREALRSRGL